MLLSLPPLPLPKIPPSLPLDHSQALHHYDNLIATAPSSFLLGAANAATDSNSAGVSVSGLSVFLSPETKLAPLNGASESWIRSLVWIDFRVAVSFFVVIPLLLLIWSVALRVPPRSLTNDNEIDSRSPIAETVLRLMTSYWQASSLLLLTVMLNIQEYNLGVFTGLLAQAMIVISLYWWEDLNEEVSESRDLIGRSFCSWRNIAGAAASVGVVLQAPFQGCLGVPSLVSDSTCAPWLEPPQFAAALVGLDPSSLEVVANAGCILYALVLAYYGVVLLPSVGRNGRAKRPFPMDLATPIGAWIALGFLDPQTKSTEE